MHVECDLAVHGSGGALPTGGMPVAGVQAVPAGALDWDGTSAGADDAQVSVYRSNDGEHPAGSALLTLAPGTREGFALETGGAAFLLVRVTQAQTGAGRVRVHVGFAQPA